MAAIRTFQALERALAGDFAAPASVLDLNKRIAANMDYLLPLLGETREQGSHEQRVQALEHAARLLPAVMRAGPVLVERLGSMPCVLGLLHLSAVLLDLLDGALHQAPPGARAPAEADCFAAAAWAAVMLHPIATGMRRFRGFYRAHAGAQADLLASVGRPLNHLLACLQDGGQPFVRRLRSGPARPALLAEVTAEVLEVAVCVREQQGFSADVAWDQTIPALFSLLSPSHASLFAALVRLRPDAPLKLAVLAIHWVQHRMEAAAAATQRAAAAEHVHHAASCVVHILSAGALELPACAFMLGPQGPAVLRAVAAALAVLPRRAPAGQAPADHVATQCTAAMAAMQLGQMAWRETDPPGGLPPAEGLLLWCELLAAATATLSAAIEHGGEVLQPGSSHGEQLDLWERAIALWDVSNEATGIILATSSDALEQQVAAARSPQERAAAWRSSQQLAVAAERLLRLLPKLPHEDASQAASLSPASLHATVALRLADTALEAASQLPRTGQAAVQPGQARLVEPEAAEAAAAIADLGYTLSKRALLWASRPLGLGVQPRQTVTAQAADLEWRQAVLSLLGALMETISYSVIPGSSDEDAQGVLITQEQLKLLVPFEQTVAAAVKALSASIPEPPRGEKAAQVHRRADDILRAVPYGLVPDDSGSQTPLTPTDIMRLWEGRPCAHVRCTNLRGASERAMRGKLCSGCRTASFCSDACSHAAWRGHKAACKAAQQERQAQAGGEGSAAAGAGDGA